MEIFKNERIEIVSSLGRLNGYLIMIVMKHYLSRGWFLFIHLHVWSRVIGKLGSSKERISTKERLIEIIPVQRGNTGVTGFSRTVRYLGGCVLLFSSPFRTRSAEASTRSTLHSFPSFMCLQKVYFGRRWTVNHVNSASSEFHGCFSPV